MIQRTMVFSLMLLFPAMSSGASFDCAKAATAIEKMVCADPLLGRLDEALAENYQRMLASNIGNGARAELRASQRKWLALRAKCLDVACLTTMYRQRVDEVCDVPVISGIHAICTASDEVN